MDLEGVKSIYAPDIVSFDIVPPLQHVGAEAQWKNWVDVFMWLFDIDADGTEHPRDYGCPSCSSAADGIPQQLRQLHVRLPDEYDEA